MAARAGLSRQVARGEAGAAYASFVAFGFFWGAWGASLPSIRADAGVSVGELGLSLAFVGVGAIPAMLVAGRAFDRFGARTGAICLALLSVAGLLTATVASGFPALVILMLLVGAVSGSADVSINAMAANAERRADSPVLTRSHGFFSLAVVVSSLTAGALGSAGAPPFVVFLGVAALAVVASVVIGTATLPAVVVDEKATDGEAVTRSLPVTALVALGSIGVLGAIALSVENAHQSWSAVFLRDGLGASPLLAALGPAGFAAVAAVVRFGAGVIARRVRPAAMLAGGGLLAATGTAILAASASVGVALTGVTLAAAGTAVCFPTLLSVVAAHTRPQMRGRVVSTISSIAYGGFLLGPALVGAFSGRFDLRVGLGVIAVLAVLFAAAVVPVVKRASGTLRNATARTQN